VNLRQVRVDVNGQVVVLACEDAARLRDDAARWAAGSSILRDISLLLQRALETERVVALQHHELRPLARLLDASEDAAAFGELQRALSRALRSPSIDGETGGERGGRL
jgi:hypothetical protein